jgi:hypothetical protein
MSDNIVNIGTISEYNSILGVDTLHPLVSVIDLSTANPMRHICVILLAFMQFFLRMRRIVN